jgi:predicted XRE-type DNA-binding protein
MKLLKFVGSSLSDLREFPAEDSENAQGGHGACRAALQADQGIAMKERVKVTKSSGNVFVDLGFSREEAEVLAMRAELMARLRTLISERGWTQQEAAKRLGVSQSRVSDLVRGKWDKFSLDMLITLAARAGQRPSLVMQAA